MCGGGGGGGGEEELILIDSRTQDCLFTAINIYFQVASKIKILNYTDILPTKLAEKYCYLAEEAN